MKAICPECKNQIDLSKYSDLKEGFVIECDKCGIVLSILSIKDNTIETEITDEGK